MADSVINIVSRFTGKDLFSLAAQTIKDVVIAAVKQRADLNGADLRSTYLNGADLSDADLSGAKNIPDLTAAQASIVPEHGPFFGWKKCKNGVIVKLAIGTKAKRSNATRRKCRAEYVKVLEVIGATTGISQHDSKTEYKVGSIVRCNKWEENRWIECGGGIHFFLTRIEAENY